MTLAERLAAIRDPDSECTPEEIERFATDLRAALQFSKACVDRGCYSEPIEFSEAHGNLVTLADEFLQEQSRSSANPASEHHVDDIASLAETLNAHHVLVEDIRSALDARWIGILRNADPFSRMASLRRLRELRPQDRRLHDAVIELESVMADWWLDDARTPPERVAARSSLSGYTPVTRKLKSAMKKRAEAEKAALLESSGSRVRDAIAEADAADDLDAPSLIESALTILEGALADDALPDGRDWNAESTRLADRLDRIKEHRQRTARSVELVDAIVRAVDEEAPLGRLKIMISEATDSGVELPPSVVATVNQRAAAASRTRRRRLVGAAWSLGLVVVAAVAVISYTRWQERRSEEVTRICDQIEGLIDSGRLAEAIAIISESEQTSPSVTDSPRFLAASVTARDRWKLIERRRASACTDATTVAADIDARRLTPWEGAARLREIQDEISDLPGDMPAETARCIREAEDRIRIAENRDAENFRRQLEGVIRPAEKALASIEANWPGESGPGLTPDERTWREIIDRLDRQYQRLGAALESAPPIEMLEPITQDGERLMRRFSDRLETARLGLQATQTP